MTQHGKWDTLAGAAIAIDRSGALVDARDGADLGLQIFVGKGVHLISVSKVTVRIASNGAALGR